MRLHLIGDVVVHRGDPPGGNPYRGGAVGRHRWAHTKDDPETMVYDDERVAALRAFRDRGDTSEFTFWHTPAGGGASRIEDPDAVNWVGLR